MTFNIAAAKRESGEVETLRKAGSIPAVVYGPEMDTQSISVSYRDFEKLYDEAGEASLINLSVDGAKEPVIVLIQDVQYDPVKGTVQHADFRQIKMGEKMNATVELVFVGEAPAVKTLGGTLNTNVDSVTVECLPKDLVSTIEVDLSILENFDASITIADVTTPNGIEITDNPTLLVANVSAPLSEEQLAAMETTEETSVDSVEVEGGDKETADGEEDAPAEEKTEA